MHCTLNCALLLKVVEFRVLLKKLLEFQVKLKRPSSGIQLFQLLMLENETNFLVGSCTSFAFRCFINVHYLF